MPEVSHAPSTGIPPVKPGGKCGYQMQQVIETHLPHRSRPQLTGLVLWVCGAVLAGSAGQNAVASALSPWGSWNNLRQYLREWLYDGSDRARPCQTELDVSLCFAPLLRWVLSWWRSGRLALAGVVISLLALASITVQADGDHIAPAFAGDSTTMSFPENSRGGRLVGRVSASDYKYPPLDRRPRHEEENLILYSLEGSDRRSFRIQKFGGGIRTKQGVQYNYEGDKTTYSVTVRARNGKG